MVQSGENVRVFKIQKLRQKLLRIYETILKQGQEIEYVEQIDEEDEGAAFFRTLKPFEQKQIIDFIDFLADKSLSSD